MFNIVATADQYMTINNVLPCLCLKLFLIICSNSTGNGMDFVIIDYLGLVQLRCPHFPLNFESLTYNHGYSFKNAITDLN